MLFFDADFAQPSFDTAVSHALLLRVARREIPASLRLHQPGSIVAFGRQDVVQTGYGDAVRAAEEAEFSSVERLAGGRAAVFHPGTIAFSLTVPIEDSRAGIEERFESTAAIMRDAFVSLGADARIGEIPGEYCPGAYSVNISGTRKVMGVGQRIVAGAAHVGGVVVVSDGDLVSQVLVPVYDALAIDWDPGTSGDLSVTGASLSEVLRAILDRLERRYPLEPAVMDDETLDLAASLVSAHEPHGSLAR